MPARPGLTNALGCLVADLRQDRVNTLNQPLDGLGMAEVRAALEAQRDGAPVIYILLGPKPSPAEWFGLRLSLRSETIDIQLTWCVLFTRTVRLKASSSHKGVSVS